MTDIAKAGVRSSKPLIESDRVEGTTVYNPSGKGIGTIKRVMIDKVSGNVAYAVITFGGFLGIGAEEYAIPWPKLAYETGFGGYRIDVTESELQKAPMFYRSREYDWNDRESERELHEYWRSPIYWSGF